ncbi:hypothetical protein PI124_g9685 [Phytophthora idaei]|nr:hypothetical protein PI126_g8628 [Phytophthora idaei]KAG3245574.1 hypothetical protein PI124_g9685 [Phytophthora idaei]
METYAGGEEAFVAAVINDQTEMTKLFLRKGYGNDPSCIGHALKEAVRAGHKGMVKLLIKKTEAVFVGDTMCAAAKGGRIDLVALLLNRCEHEYGSLGRGIARGTSSNHYEIVKRLLKKCPLEENSSLQIKAPVAVT